MKIFEGKAAPGSDTRAGLLLLYAPSFLRLPPVLLFEREGQVIGSDPGCDLPLAEQAVSNAHVLVAFHEGAWKLHDLESRNGFLADGEKLSEVVLRHRQQIRIGDAIFEFIDAGAEHYADFRIDGAKRGETEAQAVARGNCPVVGGHQIDRLVRSAARIAPSALSILLLGESGTGKEVFAHFIHRESGRKGAFVPVNCAAIPETLLESVLFGVSAARIRGPTATVRASCARPTAARCFSTRSETCRTPLRSSCCAYCRRGRSFRSEEPSPSWSTSA